MPPDNNEASETELKAPALMSDPVTSESGNGSLGIAGQASSGTPGAVQPPVLQPSTSLRPRDGGERPIEIDPAIVMHEPFIGESYNQTYLYALPRGPRAAYVFYEVSSGTRDDLKQRFGTNFFDGNFLVMRVRRMGDGHTWDVQDFLDTKNNYWLNLDPNNEYEVEMGYRARGTQFFERIAVSNRVRTQPDVTNKHESQNEWREIHVENNSKELQVGPS